MTRVALAGALGRTGREIARALIEAPDLSLVAAVDHHAVGDDVATAIGLPQALDVQVTDDLTGALEAAHPAAFVDFTHPDSVMDHLHAALRRRIASVVGTTGFNEERYKQVEDWCAAYETPCVIAPNFSLGATVMLRAAAIAAEHFPQVEIVELHHAGKADAPSGTARHIAARIAERRQAGDASGAPDASDDPARGTVVHGVPIHSVRLPGLVAHHEIIFGGVGETLTIRHDTLCRAAFVHGVLLAIRRVSSLSGLVVGLEPLLDLPAEGTISSSASLGARS